MRSPIPRVPSSRSDGRKAEGDESRPASRADQLREVVLEPAHLAQLTPAQRDDLRLWHGRVHLLDRVKAMRGYAVLTLGAVAGGIAGSQSSFIPGWGSKAGSQSVTKEIKLPR